MIKNSQKKKQLKKIEDIEYKKLEAIIKKAFNKVDNLIKKDSKSSKLELTF